MSRKNSKKVNLSNKVEESLRSRILNLEYPHNHTLTEEALCDEFGVSRSPVREALRMLEASGIIHKTKNRSYIVRHITQNDVKELYELRLALERYVVKKLCESNEKDDLYKLMTYWQNINPEMAEDLAIADRDFHEELARIAGNKAIYETLSQINDRLRIFRVVDFQKNLRLDSTREQHTELLKAIHNNDFNTASKYIEKNVFEGMQNALEALRVAILRAYERY